MMMSMIDKWWDYLQRDHADKVWRYCGASLCKESNLLHFLLQVIKTHLTKIKTQLMMDKLQDVLGDRADWCCTWSHPPSRPPLLYRPKVPFFSCFFVMLIVIEITFYIFRINVAKLIESQSPPPVRSPQDWSSWSKKAKSDKNGHKVENDFL